MKGEWIFIRKNGYNITAFKHLERAKINFKLACSRSDPKKDIVEMITESGEILDII